MVDLNRKIGVSAARQGGFSARQLPAPVIYEPGTLQWVFRPFKWGWDVLKLGSGVAVSTVPISSGLYYREREGGDIKRVSSLPPNDPPMDYTATGEERLSIAVNLTSGPGFVEMLAFTDPELATAGKGVTGITTEMLIRFPTTGGATLGATGLGGILWVDNGEPPAVDGNFLWFDTGGYRVDMRLSNNSGTNPYRLIGEAAVVSTGNPEVRQGIVIMNNDGQTHHVAMVLDSRPGQDELRYYFDGNLVRTIAVTVPGLAGALELKRISILLTLGNVVTQDVIFDQVRFTHQALYTSNFTPPQI